MSTQTARRKSLVSFVVEVISALPGFQNLFAIGFLGGGILTLLAGLVGLVTWIFAVIAKVTNSQIELGGYGWLFAGTALVLFAFDAAFAPMTFEGGSDYQTQREMYWTLGLSVICLIVTAAAAYLILTGSPHAMTLVLIVPIFNLALFIFDIIAMIKSL